MRSNTQNLQHRPWSVTQLAQRSHRASTKCPRNLGHYLSGPNRVMQSVMRFESRTPNRAIRKSFFGGLQNPLDSS